MCMAAEFTIEGIAVPEFPVLVRLYIPVDIGGTFCPGFHCAECCCCCCIPEGLLFALPKDAIPEAAPGGPAMLMEPATLVPMG